MPRRIDHVITLTPDLATLEAAFVRLGFTVSGGGTHPHLGTRNRLVVFGDEYLELLAVADTARVSPVLARRLAHPGWVGYAVASAEIVAEVDAMRGRGVDVRGPTAGRLVAPDGTARGWRVASIGNDDLWAAAEPLPFLIQHDHEGELHRRELAGTDALAPHANGARSVREVVVAVHHLRNAVTAYATTYGLLPSGPPQADLALAAEVVALPLAEGGGRVVLAQPNGEGTARLRLQEADEGICRVSLAVDDLRATHAYLRRQGVMAVDEDDALTIPPAQTFGAELRFVAGA